MPHHVSLNKAGQHPSARLLCKVAHSMHTAYCCNTCVLYILAMTSEGTCETVSSMSSCTPCNIAACIVYVNQVTMGAAALADSFSQHVPTVQLDCSLHYYCGCTDSVGLTFAGVKHYSAASELCPELWCASWPIFSGCQSFVSAK